MPSPRPLRSLAPLAAALALALPACKADLDVTPPGTITCASGTCPDGWTCNTKLRECIWNAAIDRDAPLILDPQVVPTRSRAFQPTTVAFRVSEPLRFPPAVTLAGGASLALVQPQSGLDYAYAYLPSGFEVEDVPQAVTIQIEDRQGNETSGGGGFLVFDFTRPAIDLPASTVPPDPLAVGSTITVSIRVTEPLVGDPYVRLASGAAPLGDFTRVGRTGNDYLYAYTSNDPAAVAGVEDEGASGQTILVDLEDLVGNRAEGLVLGRAVFDRTPPALATAANVSTPFAGEGVPVSVTFTVDEPLSATPAVSLDGNPALPFTLSNADPNGRTFTFVRPIERGDGAGSHAPRIDVVDRAGNAARLSAPSFVVEFNEPALFDLRVCAEDFDPAPCPTSVPSRRVYSNTPGNDRMKISFTPPPEFQVPFPSLEAPTSLYLTIDPLSVGTTTLASVISIRDPFFFGFSNTYYNYGACSRFDAVWVCHASVTPTGNAEETVLLQVRVTNRAYYTNTATEVLTYDFKQPALVGTPLVSRCDEYGPAKAGGTSAYWLKPLETIQAAGQCPYNPGCSAGPSGKVEVAFSVDEALGRLTDGELAASVYLRAVGSFASADDAVAIDPLYAITCPAAPTQNPARQLVKAYLAHNPRFGPGEWELAAQIRDPYGNRSNPISLGRIRYDTSVPGAPAAALGGPITYVREPWGPEGQPGVTQARYTVTGAADAVARPPAGQPTTVVILDGAGAALACNPLVGSPPIQAAADGAFACAFPSNAAPGSALWIAQENVAGSRSPAALIEDVTLVAKAGSTFPLAEQGHWLPARDAATRTTMTVPLDTAGEPRFELVTSGATPTPVGYCAATFVPERGAVLVFGGRTSTSGGNANYFNETHAWDGRAWTQLQTPSQLTARMSAAMAHDPARRRVVLFGGRHVTGERTVSDTWEHDGTAWRRICATESCGLGRRRGHVMFWDPVLRKVLLYGGREEDDNNSNSFTERGDTWAWSGAQWTQVTTAGPAARAWPLAATSAGGATMLLSGSPGSETNDPDFADSVWMWTDTGGGGRGWRAFPVGSPAPTIDYRDGLLWWDATVRAFLLYRPSARELWQWNDLEPGFVLSTTPTMSGSVGDALVAGSYVPCGAYDPTRRELVRFGGCAKPASNDNADDTCVTSTKVRGETLTFTGPAGGAPGAFHRVHPRLSPGARGEAVAAWEPARQGAFLLGGTADGGATERSDAWRWDGASWSTVTAPAALRGAALAPWGDTGLLVRTAGVGAAHSGAPGTTAVLAPAADAWVVGCGTTGCLDPVPLGSVADLGVDQALAYFEGALGPSSGQLLFFRGADAGGNGTWLGHFDPDGANSIVWQAVAVADPPASVAGHRLTWCPRPGFPDAVTLFGGVDAGGGYRADTFTWNSTTSQWDRQTPALSPPPRRDHVQLCDPGTGNVVVIGGFDGGDRSDVWEWNGTDWFQRLELWPAARPTARRAAAGAAGPPGHAVLFGGLQGATPSAETWVWRGGGDARPAHGVAVRLDGIFDPAARLQSLAVSWAGGGTDGAQAVNGTQLHVWRDGAWTAAGAPTAAGSSGGGLAAWTVSRSPDPAALDPYLVTSGVSMDLAVAPLGVNGRGVAVLRSTSVDVKARFRPCVPRNGFAHAVSDCCPNLGLTSGRCQ